MSDFLTLHTALSGIIAARSGVQTASHNVANAHSEGYTRQRVEQRSRAIGYDSPYGRVGTGTEITGVSRARNRFLDMRVRAGLATTAGLEARASFLGRIEVALAEPEMGVGSALSATWNAFEELSLDPTDPAARRNVVAKLESLTARIRSVAASWEQVGEDARMGLQQDAHEVNRLLEEVAGLNDAIRRSASLSTPNDLYDRRDRALDRLAELVGATAVEAGNGTVRVSLGGVGLVDGDTARTLGFDSSTFQLIHPSGVELPADGKVAAMQEFLTVDLPARRQALDEFTSALAAALNDRHADGFHATGSGGGNLLDPASTAADVTVVLTDPSRLAASSADGNPFPVYNGDNATWLAGLREDAVVGDSTLGQAWRELVTDVGVSVQSAENAAAAQQGLTDAARLARQGAHGVSVDEEMVSLVQYQHAYSASARVMSAVDELLDILITRTGIVGR